MSLSSPNGAGSDSDVVVRIRGLPWQATREDVTAFFSGVNVKGGVNGVQLTLSREGRPSGEAYVEMDSEEEFKKALDFHRKNLGSRYIEVFPSKRTEMEWMTQRAGGGQFDEEDDDGTCVRLRGLPFGCTSEDIEEFFKGLDSVSRTKDILLPTDRMGRATGEGYVCFASREWAEKAMGKHKEKIGHRYIEIFKSSKQEFKAVWHFNEFGERFPSRGEDGSPMGGPRDFGRNGHGDQQEPYGGFHKMRFNQMPSTRPGPYDRFPPGYQRGGGHGGGSPGGQYGPGAGGYRGPPPPGASRRGDPGWDEFNQPRGPRPAFGGGRFGGPPPGDRFEGPPMMQPPPPQFNESRHMIHMRGIPYRASELDVQEFFRPLRPVNVRLLFDDSGRSSGEADVEFATHEEAEQAMSKDKANMQHRYIELFIHSTPGLAPPPRPVPPPAPMQVPSFSDLGHQPRMRFGGPHLPQPVPPPNHGHPGGPLGDGNGVGNALAGLSLMGGLFGNSGPHGQQGHGSLGGLGPRDDMLRGHM